MKNISSLILVFVLLMIWQGAAMGIDAAYILPFPVEILGRLWELREPLFTVHLPATMGVTALGLLISVVVFSCVTLLSLFSSYILSNISHTKKTYLMICFLN